MNPLNFWSAFWAGYTSGTIIGLVIGVAIGIAGTVALLWLISYCSALSDDDRSALETEDRPAALIMHCGSCQKPLTWRPAPKTLVDVLCNRCGGPVLGRANF